LPDDAAQPDQVAHGFMIGVGCRIALYRETFELSNFNWLSIALNLRHCT